MIHLYATRKLLAHLPLDEQHQLAPTPRTQWLFERAPLENNPLSGWHGHVLTLQRRNTLLLIHNATRFPLVVPGLKKSDWAQLNDYFADALLNTLLKCGAHDKQMDIAQQYLRPLQANAPYDRSVLGTLNHAKADLEHLLWYDSVQIADLNRYRLGAWLADRPCSSKGHKVLWPQQAMLELLDSLS